MFTKQKVCLNRIKGSDSVKVADLKEISALSSNVSQLQCVCYLIVKRELLMTLQVSKTVVLKVKQEENMF